MNLLVHFLNLQGIVKLNNAFPELGHTWFISILMLCYFITALVMFRKNAKKQQVFILLGCLCMMFLYFCFINDTTYASYSGNIILYFVAFLLGGGRYRISIPKYVFSFPFLLVFNIGIRFIFRFFWDNTGIYIFCSVITSILNTILWICFIFSLVSLFKINNYKVIKFFDSISYEVYLVHALLISASTSLYGLFGGSVFEMIVLVCMSIGISFLMHLSVRLLDSL